MTDLEMTKLCAEAMGYETKIEPVWQGESTLRVRGDGYSGSADDGWFEYWPLTGDDEAMALVKQFDLFLQSPEVMGDGWWHVCPGNLFDMMVVDGNLNRAIVACVASMQAAKNKPTAA